MHFRLAKDIYVGKWGSDLIILDVQKDKYFSLTDQAADFFQAAIKTEFTQLDEKYASSFDLKGIDQELLTTMLVHFKKLGLIEETDTLGSREITAGPLKEGGLANYQWDYKSSLAPFSKTSKISIFRAFWALCKVNWQLKRQGIAGVMKAIQREAHKKRDFIIPSDHELQMLSDSVDIACALYPKKVYCLGWAATFVLLALKKGWRCSLAIGVQGVPFYAHAWAECNGKVINDDTIVQEYLTVLLREPF